MSDRTQATARLPHSAGSRYQSSAIRSKVCVKAMRAPMHKSLQARQRPRLSIFAAWGLAWGSLFAVAACHAPPKPPVAVAEPLPLPPPPAPAPPPLPAAPTIVRTTSWSFAVGSEGCVAQASGAAGGFGVVVQSDGTVNFTVADGAGDLRVLRVGTKVPVNFDGPAGSWTMPGQVQGGGKVQASVPGGDEALSMVLAVLGGGEAKAGAAGPAGGGIEIPPAGDAGSRWFVCARHREHA